MRQEIVTRKRGSRSSVRRHFHLIDPLPWKLGGLVSAFDSTDDTIRLEIYQGFTGVVPVLQLVLTPLAASL